MGDHEYGDPGLAALRQALLGGRRKVDTVDQRRGQLRREVNRHRMKLDAAERRLEALETIPEADPFVDGAVLRFDVVRVDLGKTLTYVTLRAAGRWYSTGIAGTAGHRIKWADLVDWWIDHGVTAVTLLNPGETIQLSELPVPEPLEGEAVEAGNGKIELTIRPCGLYSHDHEPHVWGNPRVAPHWCSGKV